MWFKAWQQRFTFYFTKKQRGSEAFTAVDIPAQMVVEQKNNVETLGI